MIEAKIVLRSSIAILPPTGDFSSSEEDEYYSEDDSHPAKTPKPVELVKVEGISVGERKNRARWIREFDEPEIY